MEKRIDKMDAKLDIIIEKLHEQNIVLARNTDSLIVHEKRTDLAEQKLELLQVEYKAHSAIDEARLGDIEAKLDPIVKHVNIVNAAFVYVIPALAAILGFLLKFGIIKL